VHASTRLWVEWHVFIVSPQSAVTVCSLPSSTSGFMSCLPLCQRDIQLVDKSIQSGMETTAW
jgi:hypothetical protein